MRTPFRFALLLPPVALSLVLAACGSDSGDTPKTTADASGTADGSGSDGSGASADATATSDGGGGGDTAGGDASGPSKLCGKYAVEQDAAVDGNKPLNEKGFFLTVQAAPFGNLQLPLKATLIGKQNADGSGTIALFSLRAVAKDQSVSEPIAAACDVAVSKDGKFTADFGKTVLPAMASPTSTDVKLSLIFKGQFSGEGTFCGDVEGEVPDFGVQLAGSKFKAVGFGLQSTPPESSCEGNQAKQYAPIASCPVALPGMNTVTSAERSREFIVQLPAGVTDATGLPIVFLYHGVGGEPGAMIADSGLSAEQQKTPFVLVAPRSERDKDGKAPLKSDWYYGSPLFGADNPDLVFFDDLLTCLGTQFKTDSQRVYVTGMSGGGLMSTFLAIHRNTVIAAATPFSGGYLQPWPKASGKVPFVVSWGGPNDKAFQQNFDNMAKELIQGLRTDGHVVVACDHGKEHKWPAEGGAYAAKFLLAHTLDKPSPFAAGLGDGWPAYCKLVQ